MAAAVFLPYYWLVYQQDRQAEPAAVAPVERYRRKAVTSLVMPGGETFVRNLEAELGYQVNTFLWADENATLPDLSEAEFLDLAQQINDAAGAGVLVIPEGDTVRVLSYE